MVAGLRYPVVDAWGRIMAMGTLIVIPAFIFTFFAARQIIAGLTAGSVKG